MEIKKADPNDEALADDIREGILRWLTEDRKAVDEDVHLKRHKLHILQLWINQRLRAPWH